MLFLSGGLPEDLRPFGLGPISSKNFFRYYSMILADFGFEREPSIEGYLGE
jgi:hypothetical protein